MGKKTTKTKSTTSMPAWATPLANRAARDIQGAVGDNQPAAQATADQIRGFLPSLGARAFGQDPGIQSATNYAMDTLGGKYLNGNPYTEQMVRMAGQDAGNAVNGAFSLAGRTGGGNHAERLAQGVANAGNQIRFGQYNQERAHQDAAMGQLPGLYASQFAGVPAYLGAAQTATQIPLMGPQAGLGVGSLWAGQGTTTGTQPGGWGTQLLGAAAQIGAGFAAASDRRLKTNIEKVGELEDGLPVYEYNYRQDMGIELPANRFRGVMADDVQRLRPHAFIPNFVGEYAGVNYGAL